MPTTTPTPTCLLDDTSGFFNHEELGNATFFFSFVVLKSRCMFTIDEDGTVEEYAGDSYC